MSTRKINKVVIHHSAVSQSDIQKVIRSFDQNHKRLHTTKNGFWFHIAYHYIIGEKWEIMQTRPLDEAWFHASNRKVNNESIGICLVGDFDKTTPNKVQYKRLNQLLIDLSKQYTFTIHYHKEYAKKTCPWNLFGYDKVQDPFIIKEIIMEFYKNTYAIENPKGGKIITDPAGAIQRITKKDGSIDVSELVHFICVGFERLAKRDDVQAKALSDLLKK